LEDEGGGESAEYAFAYVALHLQYEHPINEKWTLIHGMQSQYQYNKIWASALLSRCGIERGFLLRYLKRLTERSVVEADCV